MFAEWPVRLSIALQDALIGPLEGAGLVALDSEGDYTPESESLVNAAIGASDHTIGRLINNDLRALRSTFVALNHGK